MKEWYKRVSIFTIQKHFQICLFQVSAFEIVYHCLITLFKQGKLVVGHAVIQSRKVAERTSTRRQRKEFVFRQKFSVDKLNEDSANPVDETAQSVEQFKTPDNDYATTNLERSGNQAETSAVSIKSKIKVTISNGKMLKANNVKELCLNNVGMKKDESIFSITPTSNSDEILLDASTITNTSTFTSDICLIDNDTSTTDIVVVNQWKF